MVNLDHTTFDSPPPCKLQLLDGPLFQTRTQADDIFSTDLLFFVIFRLYAVLLLVQGEAKKCTFLLFWDSEIYFSKNDPYRGNFMWGIDCAPENATLVLIQGKIGFLK